MLLEPHQTLLFQGDSITDCGRREEPLGIGHGFVRLIYSLLHAQYPEFHLKILNRGIGGNRVRDLQARWQSDCLDLKPDWVTLMIGINEVWRRYDSQDPTDPEVFERQYRDILTQTRNSNANIILMEPFLLEVDDEKKAFRDDLNPKIDIVRRLAREFGTALIPLDSLFQTASIEREPAFWAEDGVHPTDPGHGLIAGAWLEKVQA